MFIRKRNGEKEFLVVDASMTDLIRPALYSAEHLVVPVVIFFIFFRIVLLKPFYEDFIFRLL